MGLDDAAVNVGAGNGWYFVFLTWVSSGMGVILAALIAGKTQAEMAEPLKMGLVCMILGPIGWLIALAIACKTKGQSG